MLQKPCSSSLIRQEHLRQVVADAALWLGLVLLMQLFRGFLLVWFADNLAPGTRAVQIVRCFGTGFRFDCSVVSRVVLPLALMSVAGFWKPFNVWHARLRKWITWLASLLCVTVFVIDVPYFQEFHNQFDHWVFDMAFDDRHAIAVTIWKTYPVICVVIGILAIWLVVGVWGLTWWTKFAAAKFRIPDGLSRSWPRAVMPLALAAALVIGLRGSAGRRPIQLKDAGICGDVFLDKIVMNPFFAFRSALLDYQMVNEGPALEMIWPHGHIREAARALNPSMAPSTLLDDYLQRTALGIPLAKPQHIFLVVMESYDAWAMEPEFAALHLTDAMQELGRAGLLVKAFVSAGPGTMPSLSTLITGLPEVGLHVNYQPSVRAGLSTAIAPIFKRLGYRTRFFYGGYPTWQRLGDFCREQGFDEVHGGAEMSDHPTGNEWGVEDRMLFDYILKMTGDEPTFDIIMTTSDHPPFSVDVAAAGFALKVLPAELAQKFKASAEDVRILGHLWYSDHCLGEFVRQAQSRLARSLFAITGDHYSRRCLNPHPTIFERRAVPLVLLGPGILPFSQPPQPMAGSHLDILPTLIELAAPAGFVYHAFGRNLLDYSQPQIGFGANAVVTPEFILEVTPAAGPESLSGQPMTLAGLPDQLRERFRQLHALAWWRVRCGNELEEK